MKNILLLGATGFIGKNLLNLLKDDLNYNLVILTRDKNYIDRVIFSAKNIVLIEGDLKDIKVVQIAIDNYRIDTVIHLVSNLIPSSNQESFYAENENIILPTFKLIDFISEKDIKLIFFSSGGTIYGNFEENLTENSVLSPINYYGYSKLTIENYIKFKQQTKSLRFIILRPSNVYGKHQRFDRNQGFISVAIYRIFHGLEIEIWGNGSVIRDYVHATDIASITKEIIDQKIENRIFNLSSSNGTSLLQVVSLIEHFLSKKARIIFKESRSVDANKVILENVELLRSINHKFIAIEEGIRQQCLYFIEKEND